MHNRPASSRMIHALPAARAEELFDAPRALTRTDPSKTPFIELSELIRAKLEKIEKKEEKKNETPSHRAG